jgi:hypothetical protein
MVSVGALGTRRGLSLRLVSALALPLTIGSCVEDLDPTGLDIPVQVTVNLTPALAGDLANTPASLTLHRALVEATFTGADAELAEAVVALDPEGSPSAVQVRFDLLPEAEVTLEGSVELVHEGEGGEDSVEWAAFFGPVIVSGAQAEWQFSVPFGRGNLAEQAITDLILTGETDPVVEGVALQFSATTEGGPEGARVFWGSSNPAVAEVDQDGAVTTLLPGTASIIAAAGPHARSAEIQVLQAVADLEMAPDTLILTSVEAEAAFTAQALDPRGAPVTDRELEVAWSVSNPLVALSLGDGVFEPVGSGITQVIAEAEGLQAEATLIVELGVGSLALESGDGQTGTVGTALAPFVVRVLDDGGVPVPGATVEWLVTQGSGELSETTTVSDGDGLAQSVYTLGTTVGTQGVRARVEGTFLQVDFSATAVADEAATLVVVSGSGQDGQAGEPLAEPLVVRVEDQFGNPVPDTTVVWGTESGSVDPTFVLTGEDGLASTTWTPGGALGEQTASASLGELEPAVFEADIGPGLPSLIFVVSGDEQEAGVEEPLPEPLVVEVIDAFENPVPGVEVAWAVDAGSIDPAESVTGPNGRTQASWTLGETSGTFTATATVEGLDPAEFTAEAIPADPFLRLELVEDERIGVDRDVTLRVTLVPEPEEEVAIAFSVDDPTRLALGQESFVVGPGQSEAEITVTGLNQGNTTIRAAAEGYLDGALPVEVTLRIISLPSTLNVAFGGTTSIPVQLAQAAPQGGVTVTLESDDPDVVGIETPTVFIAQGLLTANGTVSGVTPGIATVTATSPEYVAGTSMVSTTAALQIVQSALTINESFGGTLQIRLTSAGSPVPAPAPGIPVSLTAADPECVQVPAQVTIPTGLTEVGAQVEWAGEAETQCQSLVTVTAPDIESDQVNVTVNPVPGISAAANTTGSGLQRSLNGTLGASNHGGTTVTLTSSDPDVLLLAPNGSTPGAASIQIQILSGNNGFSYWIQGEDGATGQIAVTISAPGFNEHEVVHTVVTPAMDIPSLTGSTTTLSPNSNFQVRLGIPNQAQSAMSVELQRRAGGEPLEATVSVDDAEIGRLVTTETAGAQATVAVQPGTARSPTNVANGGVALDPLSAGTVEITAELPGFIALPNATRSVNITQPGISLGSTTTGSDLHRNTSGSLGASAHGGVTVTLTSSDPEVLLLAPNNSTEWATTLEVPVNDGATGFTYWVQGMPGATGEVTVTAAAPGFAPQQTIHNVVTPAVDIPSLTGSTTTLSPNTNFQARIGIPNASQTAMSVELSLRPGAAPRTVEFTSSEPEVAQLVTIETEGRLAEAVIQPGSSRTPTNVGNGGVALDPLTGGSTEVSVALAGFMLLPNGTRTVTVSQPGINLGSTTVGSDLQRNTSGSLGASSHGGVTVTLTSSDPELLLLAPNSTTEGTATLEIPLNDGSTGFSYWIQGMPGATGTATVTATAPGFASQETTHAVVAPFIDIPSLTGSTTTLSPDINFQGRIGIPNAGETAMSVELSLRPGADPVVVTATSSTPGVARLVTSTTTGGQVTATIPPGSARTPTNVGAGGMAVDPLTAGSTTIAVSASGFAPLPNASRDLVVSAPGINLGSTTTGSGLQRSVSGSLGASDHGGTTVTLTSSNPDVMLLAPNASTAGSPSIEIVISDGGTGFSYFIHGMEGVTGSPTVTASASGFTDAQVAMSVVQPAYDISTWSATLTAGGNDASVRVRTGLPNAQETLMSTQLSARAGGPGLSVQLQNSTAEVGVLVVDGEPGQTVSTVVSPGQGLSPTMASGGAAFRPLAPGQSTVTATIPGLIQLPNAIRTVTVNEP